MKSTSNRSKRETIGEARIRSQTGVTVLGIRRDESISSEVESETRIEPNDVLVGVGSNESHDELRSFLS
ncbi:cation:proton antiporter regulatory subunit [Salinigranum sp. GCM10025319]|uniref:cation:proton antiporter regulatory subunit n=1 Tax=Salinigranum sp. GCM10025319 TaxID=3252687 RepID=UPI003606A3E5